MEYLKYFFNPTHLLSLRPPVMSDRASAILLAVFAAFVLLGILAWFKRKKTKSNLDAKAWSQLLYLGWTIGLSGWIYVFFASQGVVLLAGRFWLLVLGLVALVWLGYVIKYAKVDLPKKKTAIVKQQQFKKYIP